MNNHHSIYSIIKRIYLLIFSFFQSLNGNRKYATTIVCRTSSKNDMQNHIKNYGRKHIFACTTIYRFTSFMLQLLVQLPVLRRRELLVTMIVHDSLEETVLQEELEEVFPRCYSVTGSNLQSHNSV